MANVVLSGIVRDVKVIIFAVGGKPFAGFITLSIWMSAVQYMYGDKKEGAMFIAELGSVRTYY